MGLGKVPAALLLFSSRGLPLTPLVHAQALLPGCGRCTPSSLCYLATGKAAAKRPHAAADALLTVPPVCSAAPLVVNACCLAALALPAASREGLPILGLEQEVMEAVAQHDVVVLCGETGCGKTTQVPQFLYEAGYGCKLFPERSGAIGVTQPRRVAAISTAERVADELDSRLGQVVGYQVRDAPGGGGSAGGQMDGLSVCGQGMLLLPSRRGVPSTTGGSDGRMQCDAQPGFSLQCRPCKKAVLVPNLLLTCFPPSPATLPLPPPLPPFPATGASRQACG